jgi:hypothetical protein
MNSLMTKILIKSVAGSIICYTLLVIVFLSEYILTNPVSNFSAIFVYSGWVFFFFFLFLVLFGLQSLFSRLKSGSRSKHEGDAIEKKTIGSNILFIGLLITAGLPAIYRIFIKALD